MVNTASPLGVVLSLQHTLSTNYLLVGAVIASTVAISTAYSFHRNETEIPYKHGIPFIGQWSFFTRRHQFLEDGLKQFGNIFGFNILHLNVVALGGEEGRSVFFNTKELDSPEGYKLLMSAAPDLKTISVYREKNKDTAAWYGKRLTLVFRKDHLGKIIPFMFQDVERSMRSWGSDGRFNPFKDIYHMVFLLIIRTTTCNEIAESPDVVRRVIQLYWAMEDASNPVNIMLPWLPSKSRRAKDAAMFELYIMLKKIVDERIEKGSTGSDALQVLLDAGDGVNDILQFMLASFFAGLINTAINASWMPLFLHTSPKWKERVTTEIRTFVAKHTTPGLPLHQQLSQLPLNVWEEELLCLDICLKETIRMTLSGALLRRYLPEDKEDLIVEGKRIKPGTFVIMPTAGAHHNSHIYPEPYRWDADRFENDEDKKEPYAYFGWGAGRHPCLGMRFATLETKIIMVMFLGQYDYIVIDKNGKNVTKQPELQRNNLYQVPPKETVYIKYTRLGDSTH